MWQKIKNIYHFFIAFFASLYYGFPSRKLTVIGVTGTDGKTTTVSFICHVLKEADKKASMVSTIGAFMEGKTYETGLHVTTPSSFTLQKFIKESVQRDYKYLVLEVTSHALDQYRVWGIDFAVGVLTNVTHDHLDYHKTYENYVRTKLKLLKVSKIAAANRDDESFHYISKIKNKKFITYGMKKDADINPKTFPFRTKLIGEFNKYNILAGISVCKLLGLSDDDIRKGIETFKPPLGRQEIIYENDFSVMIDFAHTPNAFKELLSSIRPEVKGRIIHVFGCPGKRDVLKRPLMGKISSKYADVIVLTADDPRSERIEKIIKNIESGIKNYKLRIANRTLFEIPNRKKAVEFAIRIAKKGDFVVLAGKAHEKSISLKHGEARWDEYEAARKALKTRL